METYKFGNKVTCIIRSYTSGKIGEIDMKWGNQPYTVINSTEAKLTFTSKTVNATSSLITDMNYNNDNLREITLSNVPLTDKILNLIFTKNDIEPLKVKIENYVSDEEGIIYFNNTEEIYQLFIYDDQGELEIAYGQYNEDSIQLLKPNSSYLFIYNKKTDKSYQLNKPNNSYFTIDLKTEGNIDNQTAPMTIHIEKCGIKIDKNLSFTQTANTINLIFTVISDSLNYITLD